MFNNKEDFHAYFAKNIRRLNQQKINSNIITAPFIMIREQNGKMVLMDCLLAHEMTSTLGQQPAVPIDSDDLPDLEEVNNLPITFNNEEEELKAALELSQSSTKSETEIKRQIKKAINTPITSNNALQRSQTEWLQGSKNPFYMKNKEQNVNVKDSKQEKTESKEKPSNKYDDLQKYYKLWRNAR